MRLLALILFLLPIATSASEQPKPGTLLWSFMSSQRRISSTPLIDGERAYFVAKGPDTDLVTRVFCVDPATGQQLWETELGDCCAYNPLLVANRLVINTSERMLTGSKTVGLDTRSGKIVWERRPEKDWIVQRNDACLLSVVVGNQVLINEQKYRPTANYNSVLPHSDRLVALDTESGYQTWATPASDHSHYGQPSLPLGDRVYFSVSQYVPKDWRQTTHRMYSFSPVQGTMRHEIDLPAIFLRWRGRAYFSGRRMFLTTNDGILGCYNLDDNGMQVWKAEQKDATIEAVSGDSIVCSLPGGFLACFDAKNGRERWRRYIDKLFDPPVVYNGQVLVAAEKFLSVLRLDNGAHLWEQYAKCHFEGPPAPYKDRVLISGCINQRQRVLFAYALAEKLPPK